MLILRAILVLFLLQIATAKCNFKKIFQVPHEKDKLQILERSSFDSEEDETTKQHKAQHFQQHNKPHAVANAQVLLQIPEFSSRVKEEPPSHIPYYVLPTGQKDTNCKLEKVLIPAAYFPVMSCDNSKTPPPLMYPGSCPCAENSRNQITKPPKDKNFIIRESEKKMWDAWIKAIEKQFPNNDKGETTTLPPQGIEDDDDSDFRMGSGKIANKPKKEPIVNWSTQDLADVISLIKTLLGEPTTTTTPAPIKPTTPAKPTEKDREDLYMLEMLPSFIKSLQGAGDPQFSKADIELAIASIEDYINKAKLLMDDNPIPNLNKPQTNTTTTTTTTANVITTTPAPNVNSTTTTTSPNANNTTENVPTTTPVSSVNGTTTTQNSNTTQNTSTTTPVTNNTTVLIQTTTVPTTTQNNTSSVPSTNTTQETGSGEDTENDASFRMLDSLPRRPRPNPKDQEMQEIKNSILLLTDMMNTLISLKVAESTTTTTTTTASPTSSSTVETVTIPTPTEAPTQQENVTESTAYNNLMLLLNSDGSSELSRANLENLARILEDILRLKTIFGIINPNLLFPPQVPTTEAAPIEETNSTVTETTPNVTVTELPIINSTDSSNTTTTNSTTTESILQVDCGNPIIAEVGSKYCPSIVIPSNQIPKCKRPNNHNIFTSSQSTVQSQNKEMPPIFEEVRNGYVCPKCVQQSQYLSQQYKNDHYLNGKHKSTTFNNEKLVYYNPYDDDDDDDTDDSAESDSLDHIENWKYQHSPKTCGSTYRHY